MKCPFFVEVVVQDKSWREDHDFVRTWRIGAVDEDTGSNTACDVIRSFVVSTLKGSTVCFII